MGLGAAFKGVDSSGVARFDASSMVAWREKQTLERMKLEEIQRARVCVCTCAGVSLLRAVHAPEFESFEAYACCSPQSRQDRPLLVGGCSRKPRQISMS